MKKVSIVLLFAAVSFTFTACDNRDEKGTTDTSNSDMSRNETDSTRGDKPGDTPASRISTTPVDKESTDFVLKAASGGLMEVEAGTLAQQKAKSKRVKDFGSMMVRDHSKANEELKSIASAKNINIPTAMLPAHQKHIDMMAKMSGAAFDKHYMSMMLDDHKKDVSDFKKASTGLKDDAIKSFAGKTLPTLQMHLDSAKAIHGMK